MKKTIAVLLSLIAIMVLSACGNDTAKTGEPAASSVAAAKTETAPAVGQAYDCKFFTITPAQGWEAGPLTFGMVNILPKGKTSPGLYFKFEGDGNAAGSAEASIDTMIKNYGGSAMEDTVIAGTGFKTTTFRFSGMTQTMHVAFRSGTKITITIEGPNGKDNADIKAMLGTLVLK